MTRFKDPGQQAMYEQTKRLGRDGVWIGGVSAEAFKKGLAGIPHRWPKTSKAYAAWAAGRDLRKEKQK